MSNSSTFRSLALLVAICFAITTSVRAEILLNANFNNETLNQPIPLGGAAAGEPVSLDSPGMATVRQGAFSTQSLQIVDQVTTRSSPVRFEFLNSAEVTTGILHLSLNAYFGQLGNYDFGLREQGSSSRDFFDFYTSDIGTLFVTTSTYLANFSYSALTPLHFDFVFDMDLRTVSGSVNGMVLATDVPMGITDRGIGALLAGQGFDADLNGKFDIDDLVVESFPQEVFSDGFDD